jgi:hypothetical protein
MSSELEKLVREIAGKPAEPETKAALDEELRDEWVSKLIKESGLVFCCTCQRFIDDEKHNIAHIFARNTKEIREKSIIERMLGKTEESNGGPMNE